MLTDIESSTRRWESNPAAMRAAMAVHDGLVTSAVGSHRGHLVEAGREGDSILAAFRWAADAVGAATAIQRSFGTERWPDGAELRIRIALHTGEAEMRGNHYYGQAVYRCARLLAAGNGGQVLLSESTRQVAVDSLPAGVSLIDQGEHRLKDLVRPERIYQLADEQATPDLRPLRSLDRRLTNLPAQLTPLVGRDAVLEELAAIRRHTRLLTLTGSGGSGKTRLAVELAGGASAEAEDGVWLVELGNVSDPRSVVPAIGRVLGLVEQPGRGLIDSLADQVGARRLLLVLDNCEHLVAAVAEVVEAVLRGCPGIDILATSREPLGVPGEVTWRVPPLEPADALALFLDRAREHQPGLALNEATNRAAAQVCARLDGMPLALELAAAQADALSVDAIAARIEDRFLLLSRGSRTAPARQQTLRATVEWSYNLLDREEMTLLRRLSVFGGGFDLAAAEAVAADAELAVPAVVPCLARLVRKSLLVPDEGRYRMHETIREFALEQLEAAGETAEPQGRFAAHLLARLGRRAPGRTGEWLDEAELEQDNLRAALAWSTRAAPQTALEIAHGLFDFWNLRGHVAEGRAAVDAALEAAPEGSSEALQCRVDSAAFTYLQGEHAEARAQLERVLAEATAIDDQKAFGRALYISAVVETATGDPVRAEAHVEEGLQLWQRLGDARMEAEFLHQMGLLAGARGDAPAAAQLLTRSLDVRRAGGHGDETHITLTFLAAVRMGTVDIEGANTAIRESLEIGRRLGDRRASWTLDVCAWIAAAESRPERALVLGGAAAAMHAFAGTTVPATWQALTASFLGRARAALAPEVAEAAWQRGRSLSYLDAVAYGLDPAV